MRKTTLLTLVSLLFLYPADAQMKRGGIFGFGNDDNQISSDLFPSSGSSGETISPVSETSSQPDRDGEEGIFRGGQPSDVEAVSYVIENGERVEREVPAKKKGLFAFGKKTPAAEAIEPVPASEYTPANVIPVDAEPISQSPAPEIAVVEPVVEEVAEATDAVMEAVNEPVVEEKKKKSGGLFGFFGKKEETPEAPAFAMEDEVVAVEEATPAESAPAPQSAAPVAASTSPAPTNPYEPTESPEDSSPAPVASDPAPEFVDSAQPQSKPDREGFRLTNPLAKIRGNKPQKTIDLTGAETIIQNGEIVAAADDIVESNRVTLDDGVREPPRVVDGVTTYSSWDDVNARSVSAADKILGQMR